MIESGDDDIIRGWVHLCVSSREVDVTYKIRNIYALFYNQQECCRYGTANDDGIVNLSPELNFLFLKFSILIHIEIH